ncbi:kinase-like domain-containing protein [Rhizophagus clarus]|uniref:Kinase-like domain-containing protein n=1 Tax=Rhizophagus clarus TaxID=94130 RepID=A0A8H3L6W3_9GLOM|nr:kinase-like domain-containing protein [Rhizophagus clarus]
MLNILTKEDLVLHTRPIDEFLNEWDFPEKCLISTWIIKTHGFTKNPDTSKYMIVFDYANRGDRPEILGNTPQCYVDLMKKCWNQNPLKRPSASEVKNIIIKWIYRPHGSFKDDEELISNIMEFINSSVVNNKPAFESHPQAFYTSRLFDFTSTEINKCLDCSVDDIKSSAAYSNDDNDNKVSSDAKEPEGNNNQNYL